MKKYNAIKKKKALYLQESCIIKTGCFNQMYHHNKHTNSIVRLLAFQASS